MRKCYSCCNFYIDTFCGYNSCLCKVYGSLDVDQHERHPDTSAETCDMYNVPLKVKPDLEEERFYENLKSVYKNLEPFKDF